MRPREVTEKEIDTIIKMTQDGKSYKQICTKVNKSINTVWRYQKLYSERIL